MEWMFKHMGKIMVVGWIIGLSIFGFGVWVVIKLLQWIGAI